jgi:ABC-2 type transport system ATP-binding protein
MVPQPLQRGLGDDQGQGGMVSPKSLAIRVEGVHKSYGKVHALAGVDLEVPEGTIAGLLGPNGAGKTTLIRVLTTLTLPDAGRATVAGYDVVRDAEELRFAIGLAGQNAAVDDTLTGLENLEMVGRLYHLPGSEARRRARELIERFSLADAASRLARTYSGGMRRRLDLAASLLARPRVLFLDEPTSGLDPQGRLDVWDLTRELVGEGTTVLLTTQYMEEADQLADNITVIDGGRVIAHGTPAELKARSGAGVLSVRVGEADQMATAAEVLAVFGTELPHLETRTREVSVPVADGTAILPEVVRAMDARGVKLVDLALHQPSLDDVFLAITGHRASSDGERPAEAAAEPRGRRRRP